MVTPGYNDDSLRHTLSSPLPSLGPIDEESPAVASSWEERYSDSPQKWQKSVPLDIMWKAVATSPAAIPMGSPIAKLHNYRIHAAGRKNDLDVSMMWNNGVRRFRLPILLFTVAVVWPLGALSFQSFKNKTETTFTPIQGSASEKAQNAFSRIFDTDWRDPMDPTLFIVLEAANNSQSLVDQSSPVYSEARNYTIGLNNFLSNHCWKSKRSGPSACLHDNFFRVTSYYSLVEQKTPRLARDWMTPDGLSSLVEIKYLLPSHSKEHARERVLQIMDSIEEYGYSPQLKVSYAGTNWFESGLMESSLRDLYVMAAFVLPAALVITGSALPTGYSYYVLVVPIFTVVTTVCFWSLALYNVVATKVPVAQFAVPIMLSVSISFSFMFTLLLLARYMELRYNSDRSQCVYHMISKAGDTVLLSALAFICACLCLCFLPFPAIISIGVGTAVAAACSVLANLIFLPALLHTSLGDQIFEFRRPGDQTKDAKVLYKSHSREISHMQRLSEDMSFLPCMNGGAVWIIAPALLFVASYCFQLQNFISFDLLPPVTNPSLEAFRSFGDKVGLGSIKPYRILFDGHSANKTMISEESFDLMHTVIDEITAMESEDEVDGSTHVGTDSAEVQTMINKFVKKALARPKNKPVIENNETDAATDNSCGEKSTSYAGVAVLDDARIPHSLFVSMEFCSKVKPYCPVEVLRVLHAVDKDSTSADRFATFVTANPAGASPFSAEGIKWLQLARETIHRLEVGGVLGGVEVYVEGAGTVASDAVTVVYEKFPTAMAATLLVTFVILGIYFQSAVAALRIVITSGLAVATSIGLEVLTCHRGFFDWTNLRLLSSREHYVFWLVPVVVINIAFGLALSFNVFVNSRILEYRLRGFEENASNPDGVLSSRRVVMVGGTILSLALGSMMLSSNVVLNQISFLLTATVILEVSLIQNIISPFLMWVTGQYCWWPRKFPDLRDSFIDFAGIPRTP